MFAVQKQSISHLDIGIKCRKLFIAYWLLISCTGLLLFSPRNLCDDCTFVASLLRELLGVHDWVFKDDAGHYIAPGHNPFHFVLKLTSHPFLHHINYSLHTNSCKLLANCRQRSLPTVVICSFSRGILLQPAVSERKNGCDPHDTK